MPEPDVRLRKASGGATLTWEGRSFTWEHDGDVVEVPYGFAMTLLGIQGAGFSVAGDSPPAQEPPADEEPDLSRRDASPVTAKPRAGTSKQPRQPQRASSRQR